MTLAIDSLTLLSKGTDWKRVSWLALIIESKRDGIDGLVHVIDSLMSVKGARLAR